MPPSSGPDARHRLFDRLFNLTGTVAIVTGGAGRLGREYASTLAEAGARVAIFDLPHASPAATRDLHERGIAAYGVDLVNRPAVNDAMGRVVADLGAPTILVNNAGLGSSPVDGALETGPFEDYPESAWDAMIDSHLKGAFFTTQAFLRAYRASADPRTSGSIINVSSTYGVVSPDQSLYDYRRREGATFFKPVGYSVAKSGVLNFTRWLAEYCAPFKVRVNTLVPGGVREDAHVPEFVEGYERRTPLRRMAQVEDYNGAVLFLASPASSYMTGATLVVDGGWTAR
jgi:NAD(P)-dependent dehydrogenase (short-subunit alcohol dehydrogenase family)